MVWVIEISRVNNHLMLFKLWRGMVFDLVIAYGPQDCLHEASKGVLHWFVFSFTWGLMFHLQPVLPMYECTAIHEWGWMTLRCPLPCSNVLHIDHHNHMLMNAWQDKYTFTQITIPCILKSSCYCSDLATQSSISLHIGGGDCSEWASLTSKATLQNCTAVLTIAKAFSLWVWWLGNYTGSFHLQ